LLPRAMMQRLDSYDRRAEAGEGRAASASAGHASRETPPGVDEMRAQLESVRARLAVDSLQVQQALARLAELEAAQRRPQEP
jgi:hypothetical protein